MRFRSFLIAFAVAIVAGCGGGSDSMTGADYDHAHPVTLKVTSTGCTGNVVWSVGSYNNGLGDEVSYPWKISGPGTSGDQASVLACNDCVVTCPSPPCNVTITASIYFKGKLVDSSTTTGPVSPTCDPSVGVSATLP